MDIKAKAALVAGGSVILCGLAYIVKKTTQKLKSKSKKIINEVLIHGKPAADQTGNTDQLYCVYYIIVHAKYSIDVCMPRLTSPTMRKALVHALNKNDDIKIRILVHSTEHFDQVLALAEHELEIKAVDARGKLSHEFVLVDAVLWMDEDAVAIVGAVDRPSADNDYHSTIITTEKPLTKMLKLEFDRIWNSFVCTK